VRSHGRNSQLIENFGQDAALGGHYRPGAVEGVAPVKNQVFGMVLAQLAQ
jgi:hypothetical protein